MTQFKKGDIIVRGEDKRKVLGVCGEVVFVSQDNNYTKMGFHYTHQELIDNGWKLEEKEWKLEVGGEYFYPDINYSGKYNSSQWNNDRIDNRRKNTVGIFKTAEEAIARYEEIIKLIKK